MAGILDGIGSLDGAAEDGARRPNGQATAKAA